MSFLGSLLRRIPFLVLLLPKPGPDVARLKPPVKATARISLLQSHRLTGISDRTTEQWCTRCGLPRVDWVGQPTCEGRWPRDEN